MNDTPYSLPTIRVWALTDGRPGHAGQVMGLVGKLALPYAIIPLSFTRMSKLPNALLGRSLLGIKAKSRKRIQAPWPEVVIAAGRRTVPIMRYIKKHSPSTRLVQIMWPGDGAAKHYDLIAAPAHDGIEAAANVIHTRASLHALSAEHLQNAAVKWNEQWQHLPRPWVGVLLGGSSKHGKFNTDDYVKIFRNAEELAGGGSLIITTSRRTDRTVADIITDTVRAPHYFHAYDGGPHNPYHAILGASDALMVSGDSVSMCSEACSTGKPVYIIQPSHIADSKLVHFHANLINDGYARSNAQELSLNWQPPAIIDEAEKVAKIIRGWLQ